MSKYIDTLFIILAIFISTFLIIGFFSQSLLIRLTISLLITTVAIILFAKHGNKKRERYPDYNSFATYCIIQSATYVKELMQALDYRPATDDDGFCVIDDTAYFFNIKFSKPGKDYVVNVYNTCKNKGCSKAKIICIDYDKSTTAFACSLIGVNIKFSTLRPLYKKAKKAGLLKKEQHVLSNRGNLKNILPLIFSKKNSYRFLISSAILFLLSTLTPLKTYYIATATVCMLLAVISRVVSEKERF